MKKKLNIDIITNELEGASAFFAHRQPQPEKKPAKEAQKQLSKTSTERNLPVPVAHDVQDTSLLSTKEKTKYGTYLTDDSIEKIRIRAIQTKRDDHQIIQEAINQYFERLEK